jgi:hypothetical protein
MDITDKLINKPFVAVIGGKKREIGRISDARYTAGSIQITAEVTDEATAELLNTAERANLIDEGAI